MNTDTCTLPSWLVTPDPTPPAKSKSAKELLYAEYENIFERVVEGIYRGKHIRRLIENDNRIVSYEDFMKWIKRDHSRYERYKEAQELRMEFVANDIVEISDGIDSIDPSSSDSINRDKLRIDTRKWLMSAYNKKRYGEIKQVELNTTISLTDALRDADRRMIEGQVIDITPRLEND